MSPRIPNESLVEVAVIADDDSARNVPEAERRALLIERLEEAELELTIQASALRLQSLALAQALIEEDAGIA